jgi:tetratricopeptide (TPR) repeat protein
MKMKIRFLVISAVVLLPAAQSAFGIDNPAGITTVPQSSLSSGVIRNPVSDYYDYQLNGNLIVTGNVEGGRHFRGLVPYRSTFEFTAPLGSSTIDSFIRDSARTYYPDLPPGVAEPYYQPSRTVTTLGQTGRSSLQFFYDHLEQHTRQMFSAAAKSSIEVQPQISPLKTYRKGRPLSMALEDLEDLISVPPAQPQTTTEPDTSTLENRISELASQLRQEMDATSNLRENLQDESLKTPSQKTQDYKTERPEEPEKPVEQTKPDEKPKAEQEHPADIYKKMEQQIELELQKSMEQVKAKAVQAEKEKQKPQTDSATEKTSKSDSRRQLIYEHFLKDRSAKSDNSSWQNAIARKLFLKKHVEQGVPTGIYKSFGDLADAKFNQYLQAAGEYMKQGEYYRAADAWTLASTYKPDNPVAHAGKAYALFAVGEYMSSAYFLSRAIEIFPGYMQLKVQLETIITDKDVMDRRTTDLAKWATTSEAGELYFLLAYVYYRLNKLDFAEEAIEITLEKMPDSPAVITLKNVIFKAIGRSL